MVKQLKSVKTKRKKVKKKVELTPAQQAEMQERMKKLREARQAKRGNEPPKNIHPTVLALDDTHTFSLDNVRKWIKHNRELLNSQRNAVRQKVPGALMQYENIRGYIADMEHYIRTGDWISNTYGLEQQNKTKWRTITPINKQLEEV
jgi:uncharacterized Rmd1/YagE family protein